MNALVKQMSSKPEQCLATTTQRLAFKDLKTISDVLL
jgi:hypothetical protein